MLPSLSIQNSANVALVESELLSYVSLAQPSIPKIENSSHVSFINFGVKVIATFWRIIPALADAVCHVIKTGSAKQMIGIATRRIVTSVTDKISGWNFPNQKLVSKPAYDKSLSRNNHCAVVFRRPRPFPNPTSIWALLINLVPKSLFGMVFSPTFLYQCSASGFSIICHEINMPVARRYGNNNL